LPYFVTDETAGDFDITIDAYNTAGLIDSTTITIENSSDDGVVILDLSRVNLSSVESILNQEDLLYYTIVGNAFPFTVNLECQKKYETYPVVFMNKWGAYESHYFTKAHAKTIEVERKEYQKQGYIVGASGQVSYAANNVINQQRNIYAQSVKQRWQLKSDLLTDGDWQWLGQLVGSVETYLLINGVLVPVIISNTNYQYNYYQKDSLTQLVLDVEFSAPYNTQFR
jgi:hypothetical protein